MVYYYIPKCYITKSMFLKGGSMYRNEGELDVFVEWNYGNSFWGGYYDCV